jgi:hypothetical protein
MELYLQFGYGMMEHCRTLLRSWEGGSVILSPRDLTDDQLVRFGSDIRDIPGGNWSARLEMCQWRRETRDKERQWDEARSTSLSKW